MVQAPVGLAVIPPSQQEDFAVGDVDEEQQVAAAQQGGVDGREVTGNRVWVPIIRSWALTRGFALHPGTRNRYKIRYTTNQHRPPSRQVNDHGRVSGTHTVPARR